MENSQKIRKQYETTYSVARAYYGVVSALNNLSLTNKQLDLMAYMATTGEDFNRKEFVKEKNTSDSALSVVLFKLRKKGVVVGNKLHPSLKKIDFNVPFTLSISISNETN